MYTQLDDQKQAKKINEYLMLYPNATKKEVTTNLYTNHYRIKYLINQGLINGFFRKIT